AHPGIFARIVVTFTAFTILMLFALTYSINASVAQADVLGHFVVQKDDDLSELVTPPNQADIKVAVKKQRAEERRKAEEERLRREREEKIQRLINFLAANGSPVANHDIANIIITQSEAYGADYRIVTAIMGVESGFCRQSFWYNCFGYLNGVSYSSYYDAFLDLVPKVSSQYAARYGWNFEALAKVYGQHEWERTAANMRWFASRI
ncbi:MAG: hypothetical protein ACE5DX_04560, partial [Candidatus Dojkabacteria bacterium]